MSDRQTKPDSVRERKSAREREGEIATHHGSVQFLPQGIDGFLQLASLLFTKACFFGLGGDLRPDHSMRVVSSTELR